MESIEISPKNIRQLSNISADELNALLKTKKISNLLIDVRSTQEFNGLNGHIKETKSLPFNLLLKNMNLLKDYKDYKIVTICNGGGLSLSFTHKKSFRRESVVKNGLKKLAK